MRVRAAAAFLVLAWTLCPAQSYNPQPVRRAEASIFDTVRVGKTEINLTAPDGMKPDITKMPEDGGLAGYSLRYRDPNAPSAPAEAAYWAHVYAPLEDQKLVFSPADQKRAIEELGRQRASAWQGMLQSEARKTEDHLRQSDTLDASVTMLKLDDAQAGENWYQFSMILSVQNAADPSKEYIVLCCTRLVFIKGKMLNLRAYTPFSSIQDHPRLRQTLRTWHQALLASNR